jgi:hypothetical protein
VPLLSDRAGEQTSIAAAAVDLFEWPELTKDVSVAGLLGLPD